MSSNRNIAHEDGTATQALAIEILSWLAGRPELLQRFFALTGFSAENLRSVATDPGFHAALTDFLMNHEPTLIAFCSETDTDPERVVRAHAALCGPPGLDTNAF